MSPESLLAQNQIDAWIFRMPSEGTSPLFRRLDWKFRGALSRALEAGGVSREAGTVSLLPITREVPDAGRATYRLLAVGVREGESAELEGLRRNVAGLGLKRIGLSASDFGWKKDEAASRFAGWKGIETCVTE